MTSLTTFAPQHFTRQEPILTRHEELAHRQHIGPADQATIQEVMESLPTLAFWDQIDKWEKAHRVHGTTVMLDWLTAFPGSGWQQRWDASGIENERDWPKRVATVTGGGSESTVATVRSRVLLGIGCLMLQGVVLPSYEFLCTFTSRTLFERVRQCRSPELFAKMRQFAEVQGIRPHLATHALNSIAKMLLHTGRELPQLTVEDVFEFRAQRPRQKDKSPKGLHVAWQMLAGVGIMPDISMRAALRRGQRSTADIVDGYQVQCREIRDLLIHYLEERRPALDHSSFRALARQLAGLFWADLEKHHPGISSLHLPEEIAEAWRHRMSVVVSRDGIARPRKQTFDVFLRVRAFYLDLQEWALQDASWAKWAVPSPVRKSHTVGQVKIQKQTTAEMHQRVRERLPHLPVLVEVAERHLATQTALLAAATATAIDDAFQHDNITYRRVELKSRPKNPGPDRIFVRDTSTGQLTDLLRTEDEAFWAWTIIEILRHTGVRHEELLELTHLALISYQLPASGEVIPLLQIVPSKSNEERLLVVSPELASVLATVITRQRCRNGGAIPLTARYDPQERLQGPPLPHLIQRKVHGRDEVFSSTTISNFLNRALARTGLRDAAGQLLRYTPHDFRRMFATDAVTGGLPVHIAARVLGHRNLATTQSYLAVFQDDLIQAYRVFLEQRRSARPAAEYREPTDEEWAEFQQHFERRKVELGDCGRPYGTPCKHEHACLTELILESPSNGGCCSGYRV